MHFTFFTLLNCNFAESQHSADVSSSPYPMATLSRVPLPNDKAFQSQYSVPNQQPEIHAQYATPTANAPSSMQSHARNAEQAAYSQTKPMTAATSVSQSGPRGVMQRHPSQPSYEQDGHINDVRLVAS